MRGVFLENVLKKSLQGDSLDRKEIYYLLSLDCRDHIRRLFKTADKIRRRIVGNQVHLRGIIEFSNYCRNNCFYCGIRRGNKKVKRYRMEPKEIIKWAIFVVNKLNYRTLILQSGDDSWYTTDKLVRIIKEIKKHCRAVVAISIGERNYQTYRLLKKAGAERSLFRFETSNSALYQKLHPGMSFEQRIRHIKWMKELGYQVGTGPIIGLPGTTLKDYVNDILFLKKYNIDMAAMGPYICHPNTPLVGSPNGSVELSLKMIAVARIVCKDIYIPATTALQTLAPSNGRQKALKCGANILMPNATPMKYRKYYLLYPNKVCIFENPSDCRRCVSYIICSLGRKIGRGYGHSLKFKNQSL